MSSSKGWQYGGTEERQRSLTWTQKIQPWREGLNADHLLPPQKPLQAKPWFQLSCKILSAIFAEFFWKRMKARKELLGLSCCPWIKHPSNLRSENYRIKNGLGWKRPQRSSNSNPLPWTGTPEMEKGWISGWHLLLAIKIKLFRRFASLMLSNLQISSVYKGSSLFIFRQSFADIVRISENKRKWKMDHTAQIVKEFLSLVFNYLH